MSGVYCMAEVEVITVRQMEELDRLLSDNPAMKKTLHKLVSNVLSKARTELSKTARQTLENDPRQAYRAVKRSMYKRILGGSVSILNKRKASNIRVTVEKERKLKTGQRGGNRLTRSTRTNQVDSYFGADRGFILRFLNAGTAIRKTRYGNRGSIRGRRWFEVSSTYAMNKAAEQFCNLVEEEIRNVNNQYSNG